MIFGIWRRIFFNDLEEFEFWYIALFAGIALALI